MTLETIGKDLSHDNNVLEDSNTRVVSDEASKAQCGRDYDAFVEPLTNTIYNAIRDVLCSTLPGPFCDFLIPPRPQVEGPEAGHRMWDAMAKIPAAISEGQLSWLGAYDLCHANKVVYNITNNGSLSKRTYTGKYCRLDLVPNSQPATKLQFGVCVPESCNSLDVQWYLQNNTVIRLLLGLVLNVTVPRPYCGQEDLDKSTDTALQAAIGIAGACLILIVIASIYDGFFRKKLMNKQIDSIKDCFDKTTKNASPDSKDHCINRICWKIRLELLIVAFSGYSNLRRIFRTRSKPGDILSLNGIRFLSYCYVIWGQTYILGPLYYEAWVTANLFGALRRLPKNFDFQPVLNFHLSEDSFLLISGIVLVYWFLRKYENGENKFSWKSIVYYIFHRYWRLMPTMMLCIMLFTCTYKYSAGGPMFPEKDTDGENCRITWWVDLLMVHNLVKLDQQCFGHAWFVPLIFQLHLAALVVLIPLILKPVIGYLMLCAMYIAHIVTTAIISNNIRHESDPGIRFSSWYDDYLITPWCRAGPFVIGMAYGILIHKRTKTGVKIHTLANLLLWLVALFSIMSASFFSYSEFKEGSTVEDRWSTEALIAYDTLARSAWGVGLGWIVFACHFDLGGVIGSLLNWKTFAPLSRLVYTTMLMHGLMIFNFVYTNRQAFYIDDYHTMYAALGHVIFCMMIGLVISLLWDYPISIGVDRALMCSTKLDWIRAGRYPNKRFAELEKEFHGVDPNTFSAEKGGDANSNIYVIPNAPIANCNYVAVSSSDIVNIGLSVIPGSAQGPSSVVDQNGNVVSKETAVYTNIAATDDDGNVNVDPHYETLDESNTAL